MNNRELHLRSKANEERVKARYASDGDIGDTHRRNAAALEKEGDREAVRQSEQDNITPQRRAG